jgi:hypothetical protein
MPKKSDLQHKYSSLALFLNCPVADGRPKSEDIIALIKCAEFLAGILQREADELIAFVTPEEWDAPTWSRRSPAE